MRTLYLGSGSVDKNEGWFHLDLRDVPGVDYVMDARDLSMFGEGAWDAIYTKDMIEHLGWRDIPAALSEWRRVLVDGGKITIVTPDAMQARYILDPEDMPFPDTKEYPGESDFNYFNRIMYGHQDYPENTHKCYFTPGWLSGLMLDAGFKDIVVSRNNWQIQVDAVK